MMLKNRPAVRGRLRMRAALPMRAGRARAHRAIHGFSIREAAAVSHVLCTATAYAGFVPSSVNFGIRAVLILMK